jgi:hypothetical protein
MTISENIKLLILTGIEPHMVEEVNVHESLTVVQPSSLSVETT